MQILKIVILLAVLLTLIGYISYSHRGQKMDRNERASRLPAPMTLSGGPGTNTLSWAASCSSAPRVLRM